jgi:hypothetical protein
MKENAAFLLLRLTASWQGAVGFGNVYRGRITRVLSGSLPQEEIAITVLASDMQTEAFFAAHPEPAEFEMVCHSEDSGQPYPMMPISGFVDEQRNAWKIDSLKAVSGSDAPSDKVLPAATNADQATTHQP